MVSPMYITVSLGNEPVRLQWMKQHRLRNLKFSSNCFEYILFVQYMNFKATKCILYSEFPFQPCFSDQPVPFHKGNYLSPDYSTYLSPFKHIVLTSLLPVNYWGKEINSTVWWCFLYGVRFCLAFNLGFGNNFCIAVHE